MYHHVAELGAGASEGSQTWTVAPGALAEQLDYLKVAGFRTITLAELADFFETGKPLPARPVILTFDDGWMEHYTIVFPELVKRGMVASFFAPTSYVDAGGKTFITWDHVLEMDRAGMEFGGHTVNHTDLGKVGVEEMRYQLRDSKEKWEERLGHPITALSYPFGTYNPLIVAETEAAGYRAALILCCGYKQSARGMFVLTRTRISYSDTLTDLASRLPGLP
jgi:peptidoglycan/xylan/chitin deacetylase (PgdA/CDA1 family)